MDASRDIFPAAEARVADAVHRCEKLPVLDRALQNVLDLAEREEASIGELVDALEADTGLAANVLRFANSASAASRYRVKTVRQAVLMVGRRRVRQLALDSVAYRFFERAPGNGGRSLGQLHVHAVQVAQFAVAIAERAGIATDEVHLAALLHDCGKLVLPLAFGAERIDSIAAVRVHGGDRARAEREELGADHAQAGAMLAAASGVAEAVVRAIAWHHGAPDGRRCPNRETTQIVSSISA